MISEWFLIGLGLVVVAVALAALLAGWEGTR